MKYDVIIVGAGVAGLTAMRELAGKGLKVCLLEAEPDPGGRITSLSNQGFSEPIEAGAEFIHAKSPLTLALLKEANILYTPVGGEMIPVHRGEWLKENIPDDHWKEFMHQLKKQKEDMTIHDFLETHFAEPEYAELRRSVQGFAEGFDLADIKKGSILSVKDEWKHIDDEQYRVAGGYQRLVKFLYNACLLPDTCIEFNSFVHTIEYEQNSVKVYTSNGKEYVSYKIIVTVSIGMLQSGAIHFNPPLVTHDSAIKDLGWGSVIKILVEFKTPFWKNFRDDIGFLLSDEKIPTWWTQLPAETNLLTGWLGGPDAVEYATKTDEELLELALQSLSGIFKLPVTEIREQLLLHEIFSWYNHPLAKGGYSYTTLHSTQAKKILTEPVYDTIYFAGEAISSGESQGTVEAALESGMEVAKKLVQSL